MQETTLHMIGNAHIDPVWLWQWQEGFQEVLASFRSALDRMEETPDFTFTASSAAFYRWIEQIDPAMFAEIQARVAEGRWEPAGGWWVEPDCNVPGGESFARHALYGQRYFQEKFGVTSTVGYAIDSFGHHAVMPQLLRLSGMDSYVFMRPGPHEKSDLPGRLFWWEADDGSRVLAYQIPFRYNSWGDNLPEHIAACASEAQPPVDTLMCFYGVGNHGGGPTKENLATIARLAGDGSGPQLVLSTPARYFETVRAENWDLPVVHDELQHHASGCYAAHSGIKRWNRQAEHALLRAEALSAVAAQVTGATYPKAAMTRAWQDVLFNQFHDIMAGTSLEEAYADARDLYGEALTLAERATNDATQSLAWQMAIPHQDDTMPIVVFNPTAWAYRAAVELEDGRIPEVVTLVDDAGNSVPLQRVPSHATAGGRSRITFVAELPALGYQVYRLGLHDGDTGSNEEARGERGGDTGSNEEARGEHGGDTGSNEGMRGERGGDTRRGTSTGSNEGMRGEHGGDTRRGTSSGANGSVVLENNRFRLVFDRGTGWLTSLWDKNMDVEVLGGPAARPVVIDDPSDTWSHGVFRFDDEIGQFRATRITQVADGPVKQTLRVESAWEDSTLIQDFTLTEGLDRIDVAVTVDWHAQQKLLKLRFPVAVSEGVATHEIPYGHIERAADGDEQPIQRWVDLSGTATGDGEPIAYGLSVLNDGKPSVDVTQNVIGMTVLRSPAYAHHLPMVLDPEADYRYIDQGEQTFTYSLLPHRDTWREAHTVQRAIELNRPPIALIATGRPAGRLPLTASYLSAKPDNIVVTVLKEAEDGDALIIRAYESAGRATHATIDASLLGRTLEAAFRPGEIKTWRLPIDAALAVTEVDFLETRRDTST